MKTPVLLFSHANYLLPLLLLLLLALLLLLLALLLLLLLQLQLVLVLLLYPQMLLELLVRQELVRRAEDGGDGADAKVDRVEVGHRAVHHPVLQEVEKPGAFRLCQPKNERTKRRTRRRRTTTTRTQSRGSCHKG